MTRRNIELVLLLVAAPVVLLMFVMIAMKQNQVLNLESLIVPIGLFAAFLVAHFSCRKLAPSADPALLPISFALSGIGIAFITRIAPYSSVPNMAQSQVIWLFLGVACMICTLLFFRKLEKAANFKYTLMLLGIVLLLSPMIPGLGQEIYGSRIWLSVGSFSFQPGEIAKVIIVLFMASYLAENREMLSIYTVKLGPLRLPDIRMLLPLLFMWGIAMVIVVFEKDLGSAMVFFFVFLIMLYVATGKKLYLLIGLGLMTVGCVVAYSLFSHVQVRVETWLNPFADSQNTGYQLCQAIYSIADGGLVGSGLGNGLAGGTDSFTQIPVVESDFIFADIAEEIGLLGAAGVLLLYLCFSIRGFLTAARAKSDVASFVAVGLTSMILLQAFIIVGGVTRLIPLTGLTLPFVSQGGSSLLGSFIIVGFLLRAGDEATGVETEMQSTTTSMHANSVLGRISLGKRLTHSMLFCSVLFALLVANLTWLMVVDANAYQNMPGNNHTLAREEKSERGTISTYDGIVLARSAIDDTGTYERVYPAGNLASHIVGYSSTRYGTSGIESAYNDTLKGQQNFASWTDVLNYLTGTGTKGNDVSLTINSKIQQACQDAIADSKGAAVVMDPKTGAVLGMASSPTYDAANYEEVITGSSSSTSSDSALINRATAALYAPGSTFKMVTLAGALEDDVANEQTTYSSPGTMDIGNATVSNFNNTSYGTQTLEQATWFSANTVYGQLGVQMGATRVVSAAERFGFNASFDFPVIMHTSLMAKPDEMTEWETAWAAAGEPVNPMNHESEAGPQATVLQMAMVGSAIANDGTLMTPYLVDGIYNSNGQRSFTATPSVLKNSISADTAKRVREVLKGVVNNGTGTAAQIDGLQVAGKTGTAEKAQGNDSWFVGMAPADDAKLVVAVVIEDGSEGVGTQRAHDILETSLKVQGVL